MAKMGKLTPEEEARNKMLMRERDRERKRMKRLNPEYRRMEQERDRDRKKARRANEAFRQLEKLRDKIRKERKKGIISEEALQADLVNIPSVPVVEPEVIISDAMPNESSTPTQNNNSRQRSSLPTVNQQTIHVTINSSHAPTNTTSAPSAMSAGLNVTAAANMNIHQQVPIAHMTQINKSILYPPPNFAHHPLPIAGVTLMPQLCHPILHQNLGASLYPTNGIKQEYHPIKQEFNPDAVGSSSSPVHAGMHTVSSATSAGNGDDRDIPVIEPEIILHTSTDIIAAPHHFQNAHAHAHAHAAHHLHQQQCSMFQHMAPQAHMSQMRTHVHLPPPATHLHQQHQHHMQHYAANKGS
ncbi:uncharacterized protein [Eurosta solidaginis]|uniref:uncharacterized protein n=1 Tax=Eurosta solidaginis TaxID=178769 RepID=UPI003530A1B0